MPKSGKTTLLWELVEELQGKGLKVGGFISPSEAHHGTRTAFHVMDIETGKEGLLASVDGDGPKVSKYHVDVKSFESIALPCMQDCDKYDVIVIDEIGRMEMKSRKFAWMLDKVLDSDTPLIISLGKDYVTKYKSLGDVYNLTGSNRGRVYADILRKAKEGIGKKPPKRAKKPEKPSPKKKKKKKPKRELKKAKVKKAAKKKAPKKTAKKKADSPKKASKKRAAPKKAKEKRAKKKAPAKEKPPEHAEQAKKKAMKELEADEDEDKGFMGKVKDLLGF
jgi:nucleoside-triphosphatase